MPSNYKVEITPGNNEDLDTRYAGNDHVHGLTDYDVQYISTSGHNGINLLINGELFFANAHNGNQWVSCSGRGTNGYMGSWGMNEWHPINFHAEDMRVNKIIQTGGHNNHGSNFALFDNGNLYTWGRNTRGSCGLGHTNEVAYPTLSATGVVEVWEHGSAGAYHVHDNRLFIRKTDGYIYVCGYGYYGQCGVGSLGNAAIAVSTWTKLTALGTNVRDIWSLGCSYGRTFVQKTNGEIWACGYNHQGQLGLGHSNQIVASWTRASNWEVGEIQEVTGGVGYSDNASGTTVMFLRSGSNDKILTSGYNAWGQLGIGSTTATNTPNTIINDPVNTIKQLDAYTAVPLIYVLKTNGDLYAWGHGAQGALGFGNTANRTTPGLTKTGVKRVLNNHMSQYSGYYAQTFIELNNGRYQSCGNNGAGYCGRSQNTGNLTSWGNILFPKGIEVKHFGHYTSNGNGRIMVVVDQYNNLWAWGYNGNGGIFNENGNYHTWIPTKHDVVPKPIFL